MKPDEQDGEVHWVWAASGAAISDYDGNVRDILIIGTSVDDLAIQRVIPLLDSKQRTMDLFKPSDICEDGAQLVALVEDTMQRWSAKQVGS